MLESAEKLLDYREYYCGLKYVTLYVGALSPCAIRIVWIYSGWPHLAWRRRGFFFQLTLVMRYKGDMCPTASLLHICALCVRTHTAKHRNTCFHICTGMSCTRNLCITVHWLFRRHENMLTCHCDAYYGCLWRWKLTFSMVFSLKGGVMGTINLPDLRTLSWHITHPFAVASW